MIPKKISQSLMPRMTIYYFNQLFLKRRSLTIVMRVVKMKLKLIPIKILRTNNKWLHRAVLERKMKTKMVTSKKERKRWKKVKRIQRPHKVTALLVAAKMICK